MHVFRFCAAHFFIARLRWCSKRFVCSVQHSSLSSPRSVSRFCVGPRSEVSSSSSTHFSTAKRGRSSWRPTATFAEPETKLRTVYATRISESTTSQMRLVILGVSPLFTTRFFTPGLLKLDAFFPSCFHYECRIPRVRQKAAIMCKVESHVSLMRTDAECTGVLGACDYQEPRWPNPWRPAVRFY